MIDIGKIKDSISCVDFAQKNHIPIVKSGDRCVSPLRNGAKNKTSFIVYDDHFYDFGSGVGGDVIDFAAMLLYNGDKGRAIRELANSIGLNTTDYNNTEWVNYTQNLCQEIQYYHEQLTEDDRNYLHKRNINNDTIERIKIGRTSNGRLSIPYWKNGYICYYATRYLPGGAYPDRKYMKMPIDEFNEHTVWGLHTLDRDPNRELLVIAEGAFDALSFEQENYSVISAITGHFSKDQLPSALSIAKSFKRVFLVFDNDKETKAGEKFTIKMTRILTENRIPCIVGQVPPTYKDISEYYADGGELTEIVKTATDGVEFLASKITDMKEFEEFSRRVCRYMSKPSVDIFFKSVAKNSEFDPDWLKSLCKDCKAAPNDDVIANEILKEHKILYNPSISFFEYNGRFWCKKPDTAIEKYISKALGTYATGPKLSSIIRVIKSKTTTEQLFNASSVMNFINGTLELLDTEPYYNFREHRETDYCTYCLDYPYTANTFSKEWENFLTTVTNSDDKKICLLQELSGYVLFSDNSLQKCAVLIGSGANGKSVFLNVLTSIFGSTNVSNVEMSSLSQDFQVIQLMNSMLNISAETKTNVAGAESKFKQITAGDEISACYKGKDYINFRPRAKMFLACNEYVKSSDTTDGWTRRFCFVDFPLKFVENPTSENERLIDRTLESRLTTSEQLSAIFNWALQGYVMLKRCGYFTEPDDQLQITEEFKELSNPIIEFVKELDIGGRMSNQSLYTEYKRWCEDSGHNPLARNTFVKRISKVIKEYRTDLVAYRVMNERGYEVKDDVEPW